MSSKRSTETPARWRVVSATRVLAVAVIAGLALAAAFDPIGWGELAPVATAGWLWAQTRASTLGGAFAVGAVGGWAFMATHTWWLQEAIGTGAWLAVSTSQGLWFGLVGVATALVWPRRCGPVLVAACWTSVELARQAFPLGGFPWGRLGVSVLDSAWSDLLPYVGVTGAGFAVVLLGACAVRVLDRPSSGRFASALVVTAVSFAPSFSPFMVDADGSLTVAVVQGDVPGDGDDVARFGPQVLANHVEATVRLGEQAGRGNVRRPDVVVWPENSTTRDPFNDPTTRAGIKSAVAAVGAPVLVGGIVDAADPSRVLNQGIVWTPTGPQPKRYTKHHPVPFGEYVPFRSVLGGLNDQLRRVSRDMIAGRELEPLEIGGVRVADAICFDVAYEDVIGPQVRDGAQIAVVQTSNATFVGTAQVDQQFAITRARAAEVGRAFAVASTNGITALIAPDGTVVARSPKRTTSVLQAELPLSSQLTPAVRWAAGYRLMAVAAAVLAMASGVVTRCRGRRPRWRRRPCT